MTERLYYQNSFLFDFTAAVQGTQTLADGRSALLLDRTAFFATSGGQPFDTGWVEFVSADTEEPVALPKLNVTEVVEDESTGAILHVVDSPITDIPITGTPIAQLALPLRVRGYIDVDRRQDHMQQHSGQHVLSAAFLKLFDAPTLSFHLGEETSTIDLDIAGLNTAQLVQAERHANQLVWDDRQVLTHEATPEQARKIGVRKLPPATANHEIIRLIEVRGVDLCACGGTHVKTTGQIGNIQLRKVEKVKHGFRVEFVCGGRALRYARKDFQVLTETAALFSSHPWELASQTEKLIESVKAAQKHEHKQLCEIAAFAAEQTLAATQPEHGHRIVAKFFSDRNLAFVKLYAQKLVNLESNVIALVGAGQGDPALVFAHSLTGPAAGNFNAGAELKSLLAANGGRGGGTANLAQGGVPTAELIPALLARAAQQARAQLQG
jgi:alanyl-tRNA synthetase